MTTQTEAMKLMDPHDHPEPHTMKWTQAEMDYINNRVETAVRQAIEQAQKQEPVAMQMDVIVVNLVREGINKHRARELAEHFIKHTSPPQRQWVGLTNEEMRACNFDENGMMDDREYAYRRIEAKLKSKNGFDSTEKNT